MSERPTGHWIVNDKFKDCVRGYWARCSNCNKDVFGGGKFCRNCGIKMEVKHDDRIIQTSDNHT